MEYKLSLWCNWITLQNTTLGTWVRILLGLQINLWCNGWIEDFESSGTGSIRVYSTIECLIKKLEIMKTAQQKWKNFSGKVFDQPITKIIENAIVKEQKAGYRVKVCVGSDSQAYKSHIEYATVIVILREGKGGFMFMRNYKGTKRIRIKERMLKEVTMSVEVAYAICNILDKYNVALEVHADINTDPKFESNVALKDAMGYILGMGFKFKAKPYAFASSSCADKVV